MTSLERSTRLLDSYRADAAEAVALAQGSRDNLDRDIALSRALACSWPQRLPSARSPLSTSADSWPQPLTRSPANAIRSLSPEADSWATPAAAHAVSPGAQELATVL